MTNRKQDTFIRRYANESKVSLLTKSELFRKIMELDITDYIEIVDYEILDSGADYPAEESMNWFVISQMQTEINEYRCAGKVKHGGCV